MRFSKEEEYLRQKDKKLKKIIDTNGHIVFKPNKKNQFDTLVGIVISQFISTKAANSIFKNIRENFNSAYLNEKHFKDLKINEIKKLGLSTNKARTIKEISNLYLSKKINDLSNLSNNELNQTLLSVFGIGPWSVNMFEIFSIGKLDVFSSKDAGLRLAMNNFGMIEPESDWNKYDTYAKKWSPYRTIASLHLWKMVD
jgi:DNA-3-methyladenine glycosylase II